MLVMVSLWLIPAFNQAAPVELMHYAYVSDGTAWHEWLQERANTYNATHPNVKVNISISPAGQNYPERILVMLAGGNPPDVTELHLGLAGTVLAQDAFLDLGPYLERDSQVKKTDFTPFVWTALTTPNGKIWGIPTDIYPVTAWYNKDMLAAAGLPEPNSLAPSAWTWQALEEMARKLYRKGEGSSTRYGIDYRVTSRPHIQVKQAGGNFYDRYVQPSRSRWTSPEVVKALEWIQKLVTTDLAAPLTTPNITNYYFWNGLSGIDICDGPGIIGAYMVNARFAWDIAPQPLGPANRGSEIALDVFQIMKDSKHHNEAWEWIKFLAADDESQRRFVAATGRVPSYRKAQASYPTLVPNAPPSWRIFFDTANDPDSFPTYIMAQDTTIRPIVNTELNKIWNNQIDVRSAVETIHQKVQAIFNE